MSRVPARPTKAILLSLPLSYPHTSTSILAPPSTPPQNSTHIMSSPASRRSRPSKQSTASPASSRAREPPSSPTQQATPRAARRLAAEGNVPSSSPMFFQSSPSRSNRGAETPDVRMAEASSTFDDGERTPRAGAGIRGIQLRVFFFLSHPLLVLGCFTSSYFDEKLTRPQIHHRSIISLAPVPLGGLADQMFALTSGRTLTV